jgi:hypothetical protein
LAVERGFRRIVFVISTALLIGGLIFTVLLTAAIVWTLRLDSQREASMAAEGCPPETEKPPSQLVVKSLAPGRWRVTFPEKDYTDTYIVITTRELSPDQVVRVAQAPPKEADSIGRRHPAPDIEVIICILENLTLSRANDDAPSNRLISWWTAQPAVLLSMAWIFFARLEKYTWLLWPAMLIPALVMTAVAAAIPWGVFYLIRWIARGFAR